MKNEKIIIQKEPFDYTKWHDCLFQGMTVRKISKQAMEYRKSLNTATRQRGNAATRQRGNENFTFSHFLSR